MDLLIIKKFIIYSNCVKTRSNYKFKNEFYSTKKNYIDSITKFILSFR